jgi:hypothetical protein
MSRFDKNSGVRGGGGAERLDEAAPVCLPGQNNTLQDCKARDRVGPMGGPGNRRSNDLCASAIYAPRALHDRVGRHGS